MAEHNKQGSQQGQQNKQGSDRGFGAMDREAQRAEQGTAETGSEDLGRNAGNRSDR